MKKMKRKLFSVLLTIAMIAGLIPMGSITALADGNSYTFDLNYGSVDISAGSVSYYDENGSKTQSINPEDSIVISQSNSSVAKAASITVEADVMVNITLKGVNLHSNGLVLKTNSNVKLTLENDNKISGGCAVNVGNSGSLTIEKESSGSLSAESTSESAGIQNGGTITINGGTVTATGGAVSAGIGGNNNGSGGAITINGGVITAIGAGSAAGIGGGNHGAGGTITINGGTVIATGGGGAAGIGGGNVGAGGTITINDGTVTATGGYMGAGIGIGYDGIGGTVTINKGSVTATGGEGAAGIGGGYVQSGTGTHYGPFGKVIINDGNVTATGGLNGAGIGGGYLDDGGTILIGGGTVTATGGQYAAGIGGGCNGSGNVTTISGGAVTAIAGGEGAGIGGGLCQIVGANQGAGGTITISGGMVSATNGGNSPAGSSSDIGGGAGNTASTLTIIGGSVKTALNRFNTGYPKNSDGKTLFLLKVNADASVDNGSELTAKYDGVAPTSYIAPSKHDGPYSYLWLPEGNADVYYYKSGVEDHVSASIAADNTSSVSVPKHYSVSVGTLTGGSIALGKTSAAVGDTVNLTITPDSGKRLKAGTLKYNDGTYNVDITGTSITMPASNITVTAEFEDVPVPTYSINIGTLTGGSISASPSTARQGATITLSITPDAGKRLKAGTLKYNDGTQSVDIPGTSITMPASNITVTAVFEDVPLSMSMKPSHAKAGDSISITGSTITSVPVSIRVIKADGTTVYSLNTTSGADGSFSGSFNVPGGMTSGVLYGTSSAEGRTVTSNVVVHEASTPYAPPVEITTAAVTVKNDGSNKKLELPESLTPGAAPITVSVPTGVTDAAIMMTRLLNAPSGGTVGTQPLPDLTISASTSFSASPIVIKIPSGSTISAPASSNWDGTINVPTVKANNSVSVNADAGKTADVKAVVEVGFGDVPLTFSKAVRIVIPGMAGKDAGYTRGGSFTKITRLLSADTQTAADSEIPAGGDARIDVGSDMVIWTKHFTSFVAYTQTGGSSSSGGGGGSASTATPTTNQNSTITVTAEAVTNSNGNASATITQKQIDEALKLAAAQGSGTVKNIKIKISATDVKSIEISIPKASMRKIADLKKCSVAFSTPLASITLDGNVLEAIAEKALEDIKITVSKVDPSALSLEERQKIGDRPIYNFSVSSGGEIISQFGGKAEVSIPYTLKTGEDPNAIIVYYISKDGKPEALINSKYDPAAGTVSFITNHLSTYAVGYNKVSFADVTEQAWYGKAVAFLAARGITTGTNGDSFSPDAKLTRGQFIVLTMRAYGISADAKGSDNFADAGDNYYTGYLAAAKRLQLTNGVGNNLFAPEREITRQEMFTLLYNTLKSNGTLPAGTNGKTLSAFADASQIDPWATEAMELFVKTGSVTGSEGKLDPKDKTTRAQMVQVLYNLMSI